MADTVLKMIADLDNRINGELVKINAGLKKTESTGRQSFGNMDKFANTLVTRFLGVEAAVRVIEMAFRGMVRFMGDALQASRVQIEAEQKLTSALRSTGGAVGITSREMVAYAKELQNVTTVGDETFLNAQAVMTTFTKIGREVFPEAIEAAADMAAMFGMDLQQSAVTLGVALNDPIRGYTRLRRIGISFTEAQKEQIKKLTEQNDLLGAQRVILDELQVEFGGVARALAETDIGNLDQINNRLDDATEEIGEALIPLTIMWKETLLDVSEALLLAFKPDAVRELEIEINKTRESVERMKKVAFAPEGGAGGARGLIARVIFGEDPASLAERQLITLENELKDLEGQLDDLTGGADGASEALARLRLGRGPEEDVSAGVKKKEKKEDVLPPGFITPEVAALGKQRFEAWAKQNQDLAIQMQSVELDINAETNRMLLESDREAWELGWAAYDALVEDAAKKRDEELKKAEEQLETFASTMDTAIGLVSDLFGGMGEDADQALQIVEQLTNVVIDLITKIRGGGGAGGAGLFGTVAGVLGSIVSSATEGEFPTGADFIARRPQLIRVGDNPTQTERVTVTPIGTENFQGPPEGSTSGGGGPRVAIGTVQVSNPDPMAVLHAMEMLARDGQLGGVLERVKM